MNWLFSLYLGTTVFGVGVLVVDLLGLLGHDQGQTDADTAGSDSADDAGPDTADAGAGADDADSAGSDDAPGDDIEADAGYDTVNPDVAGPDDAEAASDNIDNADDGDYASHADAGSHPPTAFTETAAAHAPTHATPHAVSAVMHDKPGKGNAVLKALSILRSLVYFSAGFGPVGLFAYFSHMSTVYSLLWSVPTGLASVALARGLMRLLRKDVDSTVKEHELLMEHGVVTVSIGKGALGKVRINLGGIYVDRYARARKPDVALPVGSAIYICDIEEDCLIVAQEGE